MDFKTFTQVQRNSSQELYGFLPESTAPNFTANPLTTLTPISERAFIDENSCNAVDIPLAVQANDETSMIKKDLSQFLCFNGRFNQTSSVEVKVEKPPLDEENAVDFLLNISADAPENTFVEQMTEDEGDGGGKIILSAAKKVSFEESMRSPDLFGDDDEDDAEEERPSTTQTITEEPELNESTEIESSKFIQKREKHVYRRYRSFLSGVIPPPSVINANANLLEAIYASRMKILESFESLRTGNPALPFEGEALFKPSHTREQINELEWDDIQHVNYHGIQ